MRFVRLVSGLLLMALLFFTVFPFLRALPRAILPWSILPLVLLAVLAVAGWARREQKIKNGSRPPGTLFRDPGPAARARAPGEPAPENSEPVVIRRFIGIPPADLARMALEQAGIEAITRKDDCGGMRPHLSVTGGVELLVRRDQARKALEVLEEFENQGFGDDPGSRQE